MSPQQAEALAQLTALNLLVYMTAPSEDQAREFLSTLTEVELDALALLMFLSEEEARLAA